MSTAHAYGSSEDRTDLERIAAIVQQDAMTNALLGIGFVPSRSNSTLVADASQTSAERGDPTAGKGNKTTSKTASNQASALSTDDGKSKPDRLAELRSRYEHDAPHAPFITEFNSIVFGDGDPGARLMFVGEAPGADEDKAGVPFVGRAGQLLNKMIIAMGLSRETVYIANVLKVRPPNNATPTPDEIEASKPYLLEQIEIIRPEAIVALGLPASKCLLGVNDSMANLRARFHELRLPSGHAVPVMPTYHPAYLLRSYTAENRGKVWSDLQQIIDRLGLGTTN